MRFLVVIVVFLSFSPINLRAQSFWAFEAHGGGAINIALPLTIRQNGFDDFNFMARYRSESFVLPLYWDLRLARWKNNKALEFEVIHHKLYLDNITDEVQKFNISHGFNMIMVNRGFRKNDYRFRFGGGFILTHPESEIRGKTFGDSTTDFDDGYFVSGPVINLAIGRPVDFNRLFYLDIEAKLTFAYAKVKISGGNSDVYNIAFHLVLGPGFKFLNKE